MTLFQSPLMARLLHYFDLPRDCRKEINSHLDNASRRVYRFVCKRLYGRGIEGGINKHHKRAALEGGYLSYLLMFWEMGMLVDPDDADYLNPDSIPPCLNWWFTNVEYTNFAEYRIAGRILCYSTNDACVRFALDQFPIHNRYPHLLPVLYERHKNLCASLTGPYQSGQILTDVYMIIKWGPGYYSGLNPEACYDCLTLVMDFRDMMAPDADDEFWRRFCGFAVEHFDFRVVDYLMAEGLVEKDHIIFTPLHFEGLAEGLRRLGCGALPLQPEKRVDKWRQRFIKRTCSRHSFASNLQLTSTSMTCFRSC